jgi:hypothetical protein
VSNDSKTSEIALNVVWDDLGIEDSCLFSVCPVSAHQSSKNSAWPKDIFEIEFWKIRKSSFRIVGFSVEMFSRSLKSSERGRKVHCDRKVQKNQRKRKRSKMEKTLKGEEQSAKSGVLRKKKKKNLPETFQSL